MKKSVLVTILSVLLILTVSCGKAEPEPDLTLSTYSPELPASFEVVSSELSDDNAVVRLRQDENEFDVVLDDDVNIYFDSSIVSKTLIKPGQTVYISGPDARNLETVIISDWPGIITEDAQMVKTEQASVTEVLGFFLEENHPELEIMADSVWVLDESSSQHVDESHLEFYMFDRHMLVMRWRDHDFPDYNLMLVPDHDGSAYWSGRLNEYGEIEEYYYEK